MVKVVKRKSEVAIISDKELDIFQMIANGKTRKEIAEKYEQSPRTIEGAIQKVFLKTDCNTQEETIALLFRNKLIK